MRRFELMVRAPDAIHLIAAAREQAALFSFDRQIETAARMLDQPFLSIPA